jgi:two-component system NtrC family sensor kinase
MKRIIFRFLGGRFQVLLATLFSLVAALTVGLSALATSRLVNEYLANAEADLVARDMGLADAFYQAKLDEIVTIGKWLVNNICEGATASSATKDIQPCISDLDIHITETISSLALDNSHLIAILDADGNVLAARALSTNGEMLPAVSYGNWRELPILDETLHSGRALSATEVIPIEILEQVGLEHQARIELIDTPLAASEPYDRREGTAGLALTSVTPIIEDDSVTGAVLVAYLFNNDFTLVDRIREVARIDTVTVFFGDLRVSTNVMTTEGKRAVGTRISQDVFDVVLNQGRDYVGRAYVVNEWFITRYEPLYDFQGDVVGSLYVGAREAGFQALLNSVNIGVGAIALVAIIVAGVVAIPLARYITRPVADLVQANRGLMNGDMSVRVEVEGKSELAELGRSFNLMAEKIQNTQNELLRKETLASIGQLAAGVAHELNNPLGTILLLSDVMHKQTDQDNPHYADLGLIIDETVRCKRIVSDLLNFARQQEVLAQDTDLHALLDRVIKNVSRQDAFKYVTVIRDYQDAPLLIQADPAQMQQVFINLLNNAAEAIAGEGKITISTRQVDAEYIEIKVVDTGSGIPEESTGKVFTPFFTTKEVGKGTGLGLAIVYGIIKMHRGQISLQSQVGIGTTFSILLPKKNTSTVKGS